MATYYVQFASQDEPRRWHTVARVEDRALAQEMARLAARSFVTAAKTVGRAVSRSALKREGALHHAEWELGFGKYREEAESLCERAELSLRAQGSPR